MSPGRKQTRGVGWKGLAIGLIPFALLVLFLYFDARPSYALDVTLQWDANQESGVTGYVVYFKTGQSGDRKKEKYPNKVEIRVDQDEYKDDPNLIVQFTITDLDPTQNYAFVVTAFDDQDPRNESDTSNEASTDNVAPPAVTDLTSSHPIYNDGDQCSTDHTVKMYWTEPIDPEPGSGLGGYSWIFDGLVSTVPDEYKDIGAGTTTATDNLRDGVYWFHIRAGDEAGRVGVPNWGDAAHYGPICIDTGPPGIDWAYLISEDTLEIGYTETGMKNGAIAGNYTIDNGVIVSGVTDVTGEGKIFMVTLSNFQSYIMYTMTISENVTDAAGNPLPVSQRTVVINDYDSDGMADDWEIRWFRCPYVSGGSADTDGDGMTDVEEYRVARENPQWGAARWNLSPLNWDSDGDGISDKYEVDYHLNPVDASDRDLDLDSDCWTNYEEYFYGYEADNAISPAPTPPQVIEVIPGGKGPIPSNSVFAVRLEATQGINIAESGVVTVTVSDGIQTYKRNLNEKNASNKEIVKAVALDSGGALSKNLWIAYYRSNEMDMAAEYPPGVTVTVTFEAVDTRKGSMAPRTLTYRIQTADEEQEEAERLPNMVTLQNTPEPGLTTCEVANTASILDGAAIIYDSALPENTGIIPYVGPSEDIQVFNEAGSASVGVAMNLLPPAVFADGVILAIPCPGYTEVGGLYVYYYNGRDWVLACDAAGNVQSGGVGWMVPGSRKNHNGDPAWIEIKVYHFSAVIVATTSETTVVVDTTSGTTVKVESSGGGGGCFIDTLLR